MEYIVFNSTKLGASHLKSGKPCQDFSISYQSDNGEVMVAIVCDGHGGTTYVRSDVGARLAAEICLQNVRDFVESGSARLFVNHKAAVTAHPSDNIDTLTHNKAVAPETVAESEEQELQQAEEFEKNVADVREQDYHLAILFGKIYTQWMQAIEKDMQEHPLSDDETELLGGKRVEKAYGTTLQCYVQTPLYWLAFHIGDGKMTAYDTEAGWTEPVPWDCRCFLNLTTSLCDANPVPEFRYAFDGTGQFPAAVVLGSDGLDDSWGTFDNLANFYSHVLLMFLDMDKTQATAELDDYLPKLSARASRDDMSVAGVINADVLRECRDIICSTSPDEALREVAAAAKRRITEQWWMNYEAYCAAENARGEQLRHERVEQMKLVSDEALVGIRKAEAEAEAEKIFSMNNKACKEDMSDETTDESILKWTDKDLFMK